MRHDVNDCQLNLIGYGGCSQILFLLSKLCSDLRGLETATYHVGSLRAGFLEGHDIDKQVHGLPFGRAEHPDAMLIQHIYQGHKPAHCTLGIMTAKT